MARQGDEITPCTLVWSSSSLSMNQRRSATDEECLLTVKKRCGTTKGTRKPSLSEPTSLPSMANPPLQHKTIIEKSDIGASNNYWRTEHMTVLTNVQNTRDGPTVQFPKNETMSTTRTGTIPLKRSLTDRKKKSHIFDGLHSASLISLGHLCDDDCVAILDKNKINILKFKTPILKIHRNKI